MTNRSSMIQLRRWAGEFGDRYRTRHPETVEEWNKMKRDSFGESQVEVLEHGLQDVRRNLRVLEVGCNVGVQLRVLRELGFTQLHGLDVNPRALSRCQSLSPEVSLTLADAGHLPFEDQSFDLVMTNETLITIPPARLSQVMNEVTRCSREYILGFEYYSPTRREIPYRGLDEMLWKDDYAGRYLNRYDFHPIRRHRIDYHESDNQDEVFLLQRTDL